MPHGTVPPEADLADAIPMVRLLTDEMRASMRFWAFGGSKVDAYIRSSVISWASFKEI